MDLYDKYKRMYVSIQELSPFSIPLFTVSNLGLGLGNACSLYGLEYQELRDMGFCSDCHHFVMYHLVMETSLDQANRYSVGNTSEMYMEFILKKYLEYSKKVGKGMS